MNWYFLGGVALGLLIARIYGKVMFLVMRHAFGADRRKGAVRRKVLDGIGYEGLLTFKAAVDEEIQKRRTSA